jgi:C-terminal processing protease CtpA/Prc
MTNLGAQLPRCPCADILLARFLVVFMGACEMRSVPKKAAFRTVAQFQRAATPLRKFISGAIALKPRQRALIVDQAIMFLESFYAHLPLKSAMYAVDPVRRLRLLRHRLPHIGAKPSIEVDLSFHAEMTEIFTSVRDMHTRYFLPTPFQSAGAYLPFDVETYFDGNERKFVATHFAEWCPSPKATFRSGVEVLSWNGVPTARAVETSANQSSGSNPAARRANGLMRLTKRSLGTLSPPDEEWVIVGYRTSNGKDDEVRIDWRVFPALPPENGSQTGKPGSKITTISLAHEVDQHRQIRKLVSAPHIVTKSAKLARAADKKRFLEGKTDTVMVDDFKAKIVKSGKREVEYGYIRIFKFSMEEPEAFVGEFKRLLSCLPANGVIIDVRDNPGGKIMAAERILQLLTLRRPIEPERLYFINTPRTLELCKLQAAGYDLFSWIPSIARAMETGATFSASFPINSEADYCNDLEQVYRGPVVLVTNALTYSAAEFFAAGFQDHHIGTILGVDNATGAAGAHVKDYDTLRKFFEKARDSPLRKALPNQAGMTTALRRSVRVGLHAGAEVEDFGVTPDIPYRMTRRDLLEENADLIGYACKLFSALTVQVKSTPDGLRLNITTEEIRWTDGTLKRINEIDVLVDWRIKHSRRNTKKAASILLDRSAEGRPIEVHGYVRMPRSADRNLIAVRRVLL